MKRLLEEIGREFSYDYDLDHLKQSREVDYSFEEEGLGERVLNPVWDNAGRQLIRGGFLAGLGAGLLYTIFTAPLGEFNLKDAGLFMKYGALGGALLDETAYILRRIVSAPLVDLQRLNEHR